MTPTLRRVARILAVLFAILIALAGYVYFLSTEATLERAEAFQFRRMEVARVGDGDTYRFFYASNRAVPAGSDEPPRDARAGLERGEHLTFGAFDSEIEPTLGLGMWVNQGRWVVDEEIRTGNLRPLDAPGLVAELRTMVEASPHRGLLVLVHGYRTDFDFALRATAFLAHVLDIDAPVLVFDWPANQGSSLAGYRRARAMAEASGADLAETLELLAREVGAERLWLMANSLGAQVVVDAVGVLNEDADWADPEPELHRVILTAPDVARAELDRGLRAGLQAVAARSVVYVSSNDRALLVSRVVNRARRLGESSLSKDEAERVPGETRPIDPEDADTAETVEGLLEIMAPGDQGLALVDVTPVNRTRNFHNFSLEVPEFFDDIFLRLTNDGTPENRRRYRLRTQSGKVYSVLTRGR